MRSELRELILARRSSSEVKGAAMKSMMTIREDGLWKARQGVTTMDEVLRVAVTESI
jgi:type IV pilus assembly protein PilB